MRFWILILTLFSLAAMSAGSIPGLDALAESSGPFVLCLDASTQIPANSQSVYQLAEALKLKVFDQDGISVLAPPERLDVSALFDGRVQPPKSLEMMLNEFLCTLDGRQVQMMGLAQGLTYSMLSPDQRDLIASIFGPEHLVVNANQIQESIPASGIRADTLPISSVRLHAWLEARRVDVRCCTPGGPFSRGESVVTSGIAGGPESGWALAEGSPANSYDPPRLPGEIVPNTLKDSDLDYSLPVLAKPVPIQGKVSLKSMVETIARETGMNLLASPGSDRAYLYVSAPGIPAGRLLKAVSLATCGTWRKLGSAHIFAVDKIGLGQISARMKEMRNDPQIAELSLAMSWFTPQSQTNPVYYLPIHQDSEFPLNASQIKSLTAEMTSMDLHGLDWNQLTPEQQAYISSRVEKQSTQDSTASPLISDRSRWRVMPHLRMRLAFSFPNISGIEPSGEVAAAIMEVFPPDNDMQLLGGVWTDVSRERKVSLNKPLRACIYKPSRSDTPSSLVSDLAKHGFNTLLIRVFADGYTAFPSKQFPMRKGLDADYLRNVISIAHSKGMKVFGLLDLLRWSDGSRDHWVVKKTDLLDRDIYGRTHSEWARNRTPWYFESIMAEFVLGDCLTGDAVSPFSSEVASQLASLLDDLTAYGLDGVAFDYVAMMHPDGGPEFQGMAAGSPGHHPEARAKFLADWKADSIDVGRGYDSPSLPLKPIVRACARLEPAWRRMYAEKSTDLAVSLARKWTEAHEGSPVWVVDSFVTRDDSLDWSRLKGLVSAKLVPAIEFRPSADIPAYPLLRATESLGTLLFYSMLAEGLGYEVEEVFREITGGKWDTQGVAVDFTNAGKRKNEFLRIIEPPQIR